MHALFGTLPVLAIAAVAMALPGGSAIARDVMPVAVSAPHERLLPLQGGRNFRDLGGYRTTDGRQVKWGLLFRSGSMHGLTDSDYAYLHRRGIQVVCDFRDVRERREEAVRWPQGSAPRVLSEDYQLDLASFMPTGNPKGWTAEQARQAMRNSYPQMLVTFKSQYRRMFAELLAGNAPLAFNCSAGKDRTGVAAALLLTALAVPRATVIDDYLLTNRYLDAEKLMSGNGKGGPANPLAGIPPAAAQAMMAADRSYIEAALKVLDSHKGGPDGWFRDEMGLSTIDLAKLRRMYVA
ncbi:tyrosine-protein phosphatase [uncultured Sphingomonas sp.]|uniref:tyrosine-protein phosphatase n=1 Tax=uncultured Sphingomonas sp. TaxID=158754 RepID=UPI0030FC69C2